MIVLTAIVTLLLFIYLLAALLRPNGLDGCRLARSGTLNEDEASLPRGSECASKRRSLERP